MVYAWIHNVPVCWYLKYEFLFCYCIGFVDMELVSWMLLFFSKLTDANYDLEEPLLVNRWDFLSTDSTISKRKVQITIWSAILTEIVYLWYLPVTFGI